jgi:hypothetical protein
VKEEEEGPSSGKKTILLGIAVLILYFVIKKYKPKTPTTQIPERSANITSGGSSGGGGITVVVGTPPTPIPSSSTGVINLPFTVASQIGNIIIRRDGVQIDTVALATNTLSYTATVAGSYSFQLQFNGQLSAISSPIVISANTGLIEGEGVDITGMYLLSSPSNTNWSNWPITEAITKVWVHNDALAAIDAQKYKFLLCTHSYVFSSVHRSAGTNCQMNVTIKGVTSAKVYARCVQKSTTQTVGNHLENSALIMNGFPQILHDTELSLPRFESVKVIWQNKGNAPIRCEIFNPSIQPTSLFGGYDNQYLGYTEVAPGQTFEYILNPSIVPALGTNQDVIKMNGNVY